MAAYIFAAERLLIKAQKSKANPNMRRDIFQAIADPTRRAILVLAVRHGLPCIFTREGIVGYLGRQFAVGPEIDPDNLQTIIEALRSLTIKPQQYSRALTEARQRFAVHSIEYFRSVISETASSALPSS